MSSLNVELYGALLGTLTRTQEGRDLSFKVSPEAFEHYSVASTILSLSVPLNLRFTAQQTRRAAGFFAELLPEGQNLQWLLQALPYEERNTYGLLRKYGKDSAGALVIRSIRRAEARSPQNAWRRRLSVLRAEMP